MLTHSLTHSLTHLLYRVQEKFTDVNGSAYPWGSQFYKALNHDQCCAQVIPGATLTQVPSLTLTLTLTPTPTPNPSPNPSPNPNPNPNPNL